MPVAADFDYLTTEYTQVNLKYWETYVFLVLIPLVFLAGKGIFAVFMRLHVDGFDLSKELVQEDNKAVCVALAGMQWAVGLVAYGALADQSGEDHATNLYTSVVWFIFGLLFLLAFMLVADKLTFRAVNIREEVKKGNVSAALVLASSFISGGIVSRFTCGGGDTNWANTVPSALLFFALCVVAFIIVDFIIIFFSQRFGDPFEALADDNHAAGVLLFCARISVAMIVTTPLNSSEELLAFAVWLVLAIVVLVVMDLLVTYLIVSKSDSVAEFHSKSWGGSMVHGACLLAFAYAIASFIPNSCQYSRAIQGVPLKERLIKLTSTQALLQWPNIVYAVTIMLYLCLARFVFVIPQFIQEPMRNWKQVVTLFLAESNVRRSMRKKGVKKGRAADAEHKGDEVVAEELPVMACQATDLPPPPGQNNAVVRESSNDHLMANNADAGDGVSIHTPDPTEEEHVGEEPTFQEANQEPGDDYIDEDGGLGSRQDTGMVNQPSMVFDPEREGPEYTKVSSARAVVFSGFVIGIGITLRACFAVTSGSTKPNYIGYTFFWIAISMVMLTFGFYFQRFLIWGARLEPAPRRNVAAAIVQASVFICVALQTGNNLTAMQEEGDFEMAADLMGTLIYYVIQMVLVGIAGIILQRITPYDDRRAVRKGNAAAAITNGGMLIAIAVLASAPASKTYELLAFAVFFIATVILMYGSTFVVVRFAMFEGRSVNKEVTENRNWGATLVEAAIAISIATCYTTFLKEFCIPVTITAITITNSTNTTNTTGI